MLVYVHVHVCTYMWYDKILLQLIRRSVTPELTLRPYGTNVCKVLIHNFSSSCSCFVLFSVFVALSIGWTFRSEMAWSGRLKCCDM